MAIVEKSNAEVTPSNAEVTLRNAQVTQSDVTPKTDISAIMSAPMEPIDFTAVSDPITEQQRQRSYGTELLQVIKPSLTAQDLGRIQQSIYRDSVIPSEFMRDNTEFRLSPEQRGYLVKNAPDPITMEQFAASNGYLPTKPSPNKNISGAFAPAKAFFSGIAQGKRQQQYNTLSGQLMMGDDRTSGLYWTKTSEYDLEEMGRLEYLLSKQVDYKGFSYITNASAQLVGQIAQDVINAIPYAGVGAAAGAPFSGIGAVPGGMAGGMLGMFKSAHNAITGASYNEYYQKAIEAGHSPEIAHELAKGNALLFGSLESGVEIAAGAPILGKIGGRLLSKADDISSVRAKAMTALTKSDAETFLGRVRGNAPRAGLEAGQEIVTEGLQGSVRIAGANQITGEEGGYFGAFGAEAGAATPAILPLSIAALLGASVSRSRSIRDITDAENEKPRTQAEKLLRNISGVNEENAADIKREIENLSEGIPSSSIDGTELTEILKTNEIPVLAVAQSLGMQEADLVSAIETGRDINIPWASFVDLYQVSPELASGIGQILRAVPADIQKQTESLEAKLLLLDEIEIKKQEKLKSIKERMTTAGWQLDLVDNVSTLVMDWYATQAERTGDLSVMDLIDSWELKRETKSVGRNNVNFGGSVRPNERVLSTFKDMNERTLPHEFAHVFRTELRGMFNAGIIPAEMMADIDEMNAYVGAENFDAWTTEQEETFARAWEDYLTKGIAPTTALEKVFKWFRKTMSRVIGSRAKVGKGSIDEVLARQLTLSERADIQEQLNNLQQYRGIPNNIAQNFTRILDLIEDRYKSVVTANEEIQADIMKDEDLIRDCMNQTPSREVVNAVIAVGGIIESELLPWGNEVIAQIKQNEGVVNNDGITMDMMSERLAINPDMLVNILTATPDLETAIDEEMSLEEAQVESELADGFDVEETKELFKAEKGALGDLGLSQTDPEVEFHNITIEAETEYNELTYDELKERSQRGRMSQLQTELTDLLKEEAQAQDAELAPIIQEQADLREEIVDGLETELNQELEDITQTEAFKNWFGNSKVVDENVEPLVVYHTPETLKGLIDQIRQEETASGKEALLSRLDDAIEAQIERDLEVEQANAEVQPNEEITEVSDEDLWAWVEDVLQTDSPLTTEFYARLIRDGVDPDTFTPENFYNKTQLKEAGYRPKREAVYGQLGTDFNSHYYHISQVELIPQKSMPEPEMIERSKADADIKYLRELWGNTEAQRQRLDKENTQLISDIVALNKTLDRKENQRIRQLLRFKTQISELRAAHKKAMSDQKLGLDMGYRREARARERRLRGMANERVETQRQKGQERLEAERTRRRNAAASAREENKQQKQQSKEALRAQKQKLIQDKQQEISRLRVREAIRRKKLNTVAKFNRAARSINKVNVDKKFNAKINSEYVAVAQELLKTYGKGHARTERNKTIPSLMAFIQNEARKGYIINIPETILNPYGNKVFRDMTISEIEDLDAAVRTLNFFGRQSYKDKDLSNKTSLETVIQEALTVGDKNVKSEYNYTKEQAKAKARRSGRGMISGFIKDAFASLLAMRTIINQLDGGYGNSPTPQVQISGVWSENTTDKVHAGENAKSKLSFEIQGKIKSSMQTYLSRKEMKEISGRKIGDSILSDWVLWKPRFMEAQRYTLSSGRTLTKADMFGIVLNMGNQGNYDSLVEGNGFTPEELQEIVDSFDQNHLNLIQDIWDIIGTLGKKLQQVTMETEGYYLEMVAPRPVPTKSRTLRGGYWPKVIDMHELRIKDAEFAAVIDQANLEKEQGQFISKQVSASAAINRRKNAKPTPLDYSMDSANRSIADSIHYITMKKATQEVHKFLSDTRIQRQMIEKFGLNKYNQVVEAWLPKVAHPYPKAAEGIDSIALMARKATSLWTMGFKVSSALAQLGGFFMSFDLVGAGHMGAAIVNYLTNFNTTREMIFKESSYMRERYEGSFDIIVSELLEKGVLSNTTTIADVSMLPIRYMDSFVSGCTYLAAKNKALLDGRTEQQSILYAEKMVIDSQGDSRSSNLSKIQYHSTLARMVTMFYTFWKAYHNYLWQRVFRSFGKNGSAEGKARLSLALVTTALLPALWDYALYNRDIPDDEDELKQAGVDWGAGAASMLVAGIPVINLIANSALSGYSVNMPVLQRMQSVANTTRNIAALFPGGTEVDFDALLSNSFEALTFVLRVPGGSQAQKTYQGMQSIDIDDPYSILDLFLGANPERREEL